MWRNYNDTFDNFTSQAKLDPAPSYAFGIKHSPYLGSLKGDEWVSTRTETMSSPGPTTTTKTETRTVSIAGVPVVKTNATINGNTTRETRVNKGFIYKIANIQLFYTIYIESRFHSSSLIKMVISHTFR